MRDGLLLPIILQLIGVVIIIAEVIIPSGGILAIMALAAFGYSLFVVFNQVSTAVGFVFVAADIVMIPVLVIVGLKLLARSPVTLRTTLSSRNGVTSQPPDLNELLHQSGVAYSDLRPAGTATVQGRRVDVVTRGEYIDKDTEIVVTSVTGNQVIVRKKEDSQGGLK